MDSGGNKMMLRKFKAGQSSAKSDLYERCVLCGRITNIPRDLPIDRRVGYVPGGGQLCYRCYDEVMRETELDIKQQWSASADEMASG